MVFGSPVYRKLKPYMNTATFYYVTNLQGDVIALVDENGSPVAEYTYDANFDDHKDQWAVKFGSDLWDNGVMP